MRRMSVFMCSCVVVSCASCAPVRISSDERLSAPWGVGGGCQAIGIMYVCHVLCGTPAWW